MLCKWSIIVLVFLILKFDHVLCNVEQQNACGGTIISEEGKINSPGFPNKYKNDASCIWIITTPTVNETIRVEFITLQLQDGGSICKNDYVIIRDGGSSGSSLLGKFCGADLPNRIWTTTNQLYIEFITNGDVTDKGFEIQYMALPTMTSPFIQNTPLPTSLPTVSCGGRVTGESGRITSPEYPLQYPANQFCRWFIESPNDSTEIKLKIIEINLEKHPSCQYDYVIIRNTFVSNDVKILKLCGYESGQQQVFGRNFLIEFKSDSSTGYSGFQIHWQFVPKSTITELGFPLFRGHQDCRIEQSGFVGMITTSSYPKNYKNIQSCDWIITSEASTRIQLRFTDFDLEQSDSCEFDFLEIYDGFSSKSNLIGRYCGNEIPDIIESETNQLYLYFQSDDADTRRGFEAIWIALDSKMSTKKSRRQAEPKKCNNVLTEDEGTLQTINYPLAYQPSSRCTWSIQANAFEEVSLTFITFELEKHSSCRYDFVEIYYGQEKKKENLIGKYCGSDIPSAIKSNENGLIVYFESDTTTQRAGFKARWKKTSKTSITPSDCGGSLSGVTGVVTSPNYPKYTKDRAICTWTITVPEGGLVHIEFIDLDIIEHPGCGKGYVQIKNGKLSTDDSLGTFCGFILPRPVFSKTNVISVGFLSDGSDQTRGFQAKWKTVYPQPTKKPGPSQGETPCGEHFQQESGSISRSSAQTNCTWKITVPQGMMISIYFVEIDMADDPLCRKEQIAIRDGQNNKAYLLTRACGELKPRPVTSSRNNVFVEHTVFEKAKTSRFKIEWKATTEEENDIFNTGSCGISTVPASSLVNGASQGVGTLPWVVAIMGMFGRVHCGGAIISSEWIITAAHCFERLPWKDLWTIRAGEYELNSQEPSEQNTGIRRIFIHPDYNPQTQENDITLLRLNQPLTLNNHVKTVCLPKSTRKLKDGETCSVAGWGARKFLRQPKEPLTHILPKITSTKNCNSSAVYDGRIRDGMICAGDDAVDSCQGDGGSPLTCKTGDRHYVTGLVSWGNGCAFPGKFGVYTDVRKYLDWIKYVLEST